MLIFNISIFHSAKTNKTEASEALSTNISGTAILIISWYDDAVIRLLQVK